MFASRHILYNQTGAFSQIVSDLIGEGKNLRPFYAEPPTIAGIEATINKKKKQGVNRQLLVSCLEKQYDSVETTTAVQRNISALLNENSFTVCTAHQPNLFTGPLYFIYKILHTIRLSTWLKEQLPQYNFIPVYYMGSEDADFAELNHTYVDGKKIEWKKEQRGAVGRMHVDQTLVRLIDELEGQLAMEKNGREVIGLLRRCYSPGKMIQSATFELVNSLYGEFGLVVLIPDQPLLKSLMKPVFKDDLFNHTSSSIVQETSTRLSVHYSVQANPREINLFYLKDDIRERIVKTETDFRVLNTDLSFTPDEMELELNTNPERFSPNVILRGLFQETILPNLVFIGGGGEMAYWLQLKELFEHYKVVYPVLVLRNSFLLVEEKWKERVSRLGLDIKDFFLSEDELMKKIVEKNSSHAVFLNGNFEKAELLFEQIKSQAGAIDPTLKQHVAAIQARSLKNLQELEKKMLRAEKRKFADQQGQIRKIREALFPKNGLQERVENFSGYYAKWGRDFIKELYKHSLALEQQFTVLTEEI
jgi:bacillithiol biosynthesis cysteine-adding enzyme BshC